MTTKIRFNPVSKEVEIEGTEDFVEKYFQQIKDLFTSLKESAVETVPASKRAADKPLKKKPLKKGLIFGTIVDTIKKGDKGIDIVGLMKATGFARQQVTSVLYLANKEGIIHTVKRGVYVAVESGAIPDETNS
jgi:hypothetical protein